MRILGAFARNQHGGVAVFFAVAVFVLFGFGAMAVDVGSFFFEKRKLQAANDLAALAAASDLPRARAVVSGAATPIDQLLNAVLGTLGIGLGQADSWVTGVRCGGAVLVR